MIVLHAEFVSVTTYWALDDLPAVCGENYDIECVLKVLRKNFDEAEENDELEEIEELDGDTLAKRIMRWNCCEHVSHIFY